MVGSWSAPLARRQSRAHLVAAGWRGKQTVEQRPQVESGSTGHNGKRRCADGSELRTSATGVVACCEGLIGIDDVQHVMRNPASLGRRRLRCPDIEVAVDLERIA